MINVCWMNECMNEETTEWIERLNKYVFFLAFLWLYLKSIFSQYDLMLFDFSVLPMGFWPRQSTTLTKAIVVLWDQESKMEGKKLLRWWKEDTRPWSRAEGIITPWIPAGKDTWRWTTPDTLTQSGTISHSLVFMKWVSLSYLTLQFKFQSGEQ